MSQTPLKGSTFSFETNNEEIISEETLKVLIDQDDWLISGLISLPDRYSFEEINNWLNLVLEKKELKLSKNNLVRELDNIALLDNLESTNSLNPTAHLPLATTPRINTRTITKRRGYFYEHQLLNEDNSFNKTRNNLNHNNNNSSNNNCNNNNGKCNNSESESSSKSSPGLNRTFTFTESDTNHNLINRVESTNGINDIIKKQEESLRKKSLSYAFSKGDEDSRLNKLKINSNYSSSMKIFQEDLLSFKGKS